MKIEPGMLCRVHAPKHPAHDWFVVTENLIPYSDEILLDGHKFYMPKRTDRVWVVTGRAIPALNTVLGLLHFSRIPCSEGSLRPIIDPGDDAVDQMVQIVGKPKQVVPEKGKAFFHT